MWGTRRSRAIACAVTAGALTFLASCRPPFPRELFTVSGQGADFPIMLSQTPPGGAGRQIEAASGTRESHYQQRNYGYTDRSQSELPASLQLSAQVRRTDKWLQIDHIEFYSTDFTTFSNTAHLRKLVLEGKVYQ
jgi:hypothetical protein